MITALTKEELLDLAKGLKAGSSSRILGKVKVYRLIVMPGVKPHWKAYYVNPEKVSGNSKIMRVISGKELLPDNHPQKQLPTTNTTPTVPDISSLTPEELQAVQSVPEGEEVKSNSSPIQNTTTYTIKTPNSFVELSKLENTTHTRIQNSSLWNKTAMASKRFLDSLYKKTQAKKDESKWFQLQQFFKKYDIYHYDSSNFLDSKGKVKDKKYKEELENLMHFLLYKGFNPDNPEESYKNLPNYLRASTYTPENVKVLHNSSQLNPDDYKSDRDKELIEFINSLETYEDIKGCIRMGIVPEDDRARVFILTKLQSRLAQAVLNDDSSLDSETKTNIINSWGLDTIKQLASLDDYSNNESFEQLFTNLVNVLDNEALGYNKRLLVDSFKPLKDFRLGVLTDPQYYISSNQYSPSQLISSLNGAYSTQTTDKYISAPGYNNDYISNLGYTGSDPDEYKNRDILQDGFIHFLKRISEHEPQLLDKSTELVKVYTQLLQTVDKNPNLLNTILTQSNWETEDKNTNKIKSLIQELLIPVLQREQIKNSRDVKKQISYLTKDISKTSSRYLFPNSKATTNAEIEIKRNLPFVIPETYIDILSEAKPIKVDNPTEDILKFNSLINELKNSSEEDKDEIINNLQELIKQSLLSYENFSYGKKFSKNMIEYWINEANSKTNHWLLPDDLINLVNKYKDNLQDSQFYTELNNYQQTNKLKGANKERLAVLLLAVKTYQQYPQHTQLHLIDYINNVLDSYTKSIQSSNLDSRIKQLKDLQIRLYTAILEKEQNIQSIRFITDLPELIKTKQNLSSERKNIVDSYDKDEVSVTLSNGLSAIISSQYKDEYEQHLQEITSIKSKMSSIQENNPSLEDITKNLKKVKDKINKINKEIKVNNFQMKTLNSNIRDMFEKVGYTYSIEITTDENLLNEIFNTEDVNKIKEYTQKLQSLQARLNLKEYMLDTYTEKLNQFNEQLKEYPEYVELTSELDEKSEHLDSLIRTKFKPSHQDLKKYDKQLKDIDYKINLYYDFYKYSNLVDSNLFD